MKRSTAAQWAVPADYAERIKALRAAHNLTQMRLADLLGVSFASVNRWENGQARPSALAWRQIARAEQFGVAALGDERHVGLVSKRSTHVNERNAGPRVAQPTLLGEP